MPDSALRAKRGMVNMPIHGSGYIDTVPTSSGSRIYSDQMCKPVQNSKFFAQFFTGFCYFLKNDPQVPVKGSLDVHSWL